MTYGANYFYKKSELDDVNECKKCRNGFLSLSECLNGLVVTILFDAFLNILAPVCFVSIFWHW